MRSLILITIIALVIIGCGTGDNRDSVLEKEKCDFYFEISVESSNSYKFNSQTGYLQKLINPFKENELNADTTLFIPEAFNCKLLNLYNLYKLSYYTKDFQPESSIEMTPEPSYFIKFKVNNKETEINWTRNTETFESEDAFRLHKVLHTIDSIILSSPEFKELPEQEYEWL